MSAAAAELRDFDLLSQRRLPHEQVQIENVSDRVGVLVVSGPKSRELLQPLTASALDNEAFPWLCAQTILVADQPVRALRVSYIGELGWELHAPRERLASLYDSLWRAGHRLGIVDYGLYAVNAMRLEKAYKSWPSELSNELTLREADMARFLCREKAGCVNCTDALAVASVSPRIVYGALDADDADARGGEPVFADGRCIGAVTSGGYGHRVEKSLFFACVDPARLDPGASVEVQVQGRRRRAELLSEAAYDPFNLAMRA